MNTLLANAAQSIKMGVEDYLSPDPGRALSGVRNVTAGVLLLFKEKLRLLSPAPSDEVLLKQKIEPKITTTGDLLFRGSGRKTVDVQQIQERFKSLGILVERRIEGAAAAPPGCFRFHQKLLFARPIPARR